MLDLVLLYAVGAVGCAMRIFDVPLVPAVLGLILGPLSRAAVPARAGDQRRRSLGVRHAADLRDAARPRGRGAARPVTSLRRWLPATAAIMNATSVYDVAVLGGGNAGAVRGADGARGGRERASCSNAAPRHFRGGNSRHTRNLRCGARGTHRRADRRLPGRRVLGRSAARDRRRHRRGAGAARRQPLGGLPRLDAAPRRAVPVVAARHAAPRRAPTRSFSAAARR